MILCSDIAECPAYRKIYKFCVITLIREIAFDILAYVSGDR